MARLFITSREIDFISDITKEVTKDIIGQVIYYYKTRVDLGNTHDLYDETTEKVFDNPVTIDCRIQWNQDEVKQDRFGYETVMKAEVYIHYRDVLDRNIKVEEGDFFSYGDKFFEITAIKKDKIIFGQVEHITGFTLTAQQARQSLINKEAHGPLGEEYTDEGAVQQTFVQQRGNADADDKRQLVSDDVLDAPIGNPRSVRPSASNQKASFYGDE